MTEPTKDLIVGTDLTAAALYTEDNINALMKDIEKRAMAVALPDTSTDKNRKEIIAHAFLATTSKTMIIKGAEKVTEEARKKVKTINGVKKIADEFLTDLAKKIRQPVTEWEKAEEERTRVTAECLRFFTMARMVAAGSSSEVIMKRIDEVEGHEYPEIEDETTMESLKEEQETTLATLRELHVDAVTNEKEKEELAALRKEKEDREKKELAEAAEKKQKEEAGKVEESRIAKEEQDEKDRLANEERIRKEEQEKATKAAEQKIKEEKLQKEAAAQKEKDDEERRIKDVNHRKAFQEDAVMSLMGVLDIDESRAIEIVEAIAQDQIDHISIKY